MASKVSDVVDPLSPLSSAELRKLAVSRCSSSVFCKMFWTSNIKSKHSGSGSSGERVSFEGHVEVCEFRTRRALEEGIRRMERRILAKKSKGLGTKGKIRGDRSKK